MIRARSILGSAAVGLAAIAGPVSAGTVGSPLGIQGNGSDLSMIQAIESMYDPQSGSIHGDSDLSITGDSLAFNNGITAKLAADFSTGNLLYCLGATEISSFVFPNGSGSNVLFTSLSGQANAAMGIRYLSPLFNDEAAIGGLPPILDIPWQDVRVQSNGLLSTNQSLADRLWQSDIAITPSEHELVTYVLMRFGHAYRCQEFVTDIEVNTAPPPPVTPNPPVMPPTTPDDPGTPVVPPDPPVEPPPNNPTPDVPVVPAPEAVAMGLVTLAGLGMAGMIRRRKHVAC